MEGPPPAVLTLPNVVGYLHLGIIGTGLDYSLWFRGVHLLPASTTAMLGLLSPLVATLAGWALLGQILTPGQIIGAVILLGTLALSAIRIPQRATSGEPSVRNPARSIVMPAARRAQP